MLFKHDLRTAMQVARSRVVAEPRPVFEDGLDRRRGQRPDIGKALEKTLVVGNHRRHLRLLQRDLGQPDAVGIAGVLPGQVMAAALTLPADQARGEGSGGLRHENGGR